MTGRPATFAPDTQNARLPERYEAAKVALLWSQRDIAREAGLSKDQQVAAVRVANAPEPEFEAAPVWLSCLRVTAGSAPLSLRVGSSAP